MPLEILILKAIGDKLIEKLGTVKAGPLTPLISQFAPVFASMTEQQVAGWITLASTGSTYDAKVALLSQLSNSELADRWDADIGEWKPLNQTNADNIDMQKQAVVGATKLALSLGLVAVFP